MASRVDILDESGIRVIFDRLNPTSDGLKAWVEIRWQENVPEPRVLAFGRYDLMGARTVSSLVSAATPSLNGLKLDLNGILQRIVYGVIRGHLEGSEPIPLATVESERGHKWLLRPLIVGVGASSIIGFGGSMKSILGLSAAASIASGRAAFTGSRPTVTGPVLYLDWEADAATHADRLRALCQPLDITPPENLLYRSERMPLAQSVDVIERIVETEGVVLVVVDSVMLARGGDAMGPEDTTRLYAALRQFGVPALLIDHKAKKSKRGEGAYGSIVNENSARLQWEIVSFTDDGDDSVMRLSLHKRNNVGRIGDLAFRIGITEDEDEHLSQITVKPIAAKSVSIAGSLPTEIVKTLKANGPSYPVEIAEALEVDGSNVRSRLAKMRGKAVDRTEEGRWFAI